MISAEKIKTALDNCFGASWHVIVGEDFTFNIDYEKDLLVSMYYVRRQDLAFVWHYIIVSSKLDILGRWRKLLLHSNQARLEC